MKTTPSFMLALGALLFAGSASASPALARSWSEEAAELHTQIEAMDTHTLPVDLRFRLQRFGRTATRLSTSGSEDAPLPEDLGCIFRGMAEETDLQLSSFADDSSEAARVQAEERLSKMLEDAVSVGEAAAIVLEAGEVIEMSLHSDINGQCGGGDISSLRAPDLR